jgi:hypothetical protein
MRMTRKRWCLGFVVLGASVASTAAAQKRFVINECTDYAAHGCEYGSNTNLNDVTASLNSALQGNSWTGDRWKNATFQVRSFVESCNVSYGFGGFAGIDNVWGDNNTLTVFAGHGNIGLLSYCWPFSGKCNINFSPNMRLGSMGGAEAGYGMWISSYTLNVAQLPNTANYQWLRQQFGWNNSPGVGNNEPRDFFNATVSNTNSDAWLNEMQGSSREPVVVTQGTSSQHCWDTHDGARLKGNSLVSPRGSGPACLANQPSFFYCFDWIDI